MPHVVIEYFAPDGLERAVVLETALETAAHSDIMQREDIKVRLAPSEAILFGDGRESFIHVTLSLLAGRTDAAKLKVAETLTENLRKVCPDIDAISVDIQDLNPACYKKSLR